MEKSYQGPASFWLKSRISSVTARRLLLQRFKILSQKLAALHLTFFIGWSLNIGMPSHH